MAVEVIDKIKPKNGGSFPIVEAVDVEVSEGVRLPEALAAKANTADVTSATSNLQSQIDQIAQAAGTGSADTEVAQARVGYDGQTYSNLKARIDAEIVSLESDMQAVGIAASHFAMDASTAHSSSANKVKKTVHTNDTIIVSVSADTELSSSVMYDVFGYVGNSGTKISSGYVNRSKIKVIVENNYESFGVYVRALGSAANVEFSVESETSFVTKCQVVEKKTSTGSHR